MQRPGDGDGAGREQGRRRAGAFALAVAIGVAVGASATWLFAPPRSTEAQGALGPAERDLRMLERLEGIRGELVVQTRLLERLAAEQTATRELLEAQGGSPGRR